MTRSLMLACCLLAAGCTAPFGVRHRPPEAMHRALNANVLTTGELSNATDIMLRQHDLIEAYQGDPAGTLRLLNSELQRGALRADDLAALAELSFHYADHGGGKPQFLAASLYAYAFLFPADPRVAPDPLDPRLRETADLYSRSLTEAFRSADGKQVEIAAGTYALPFGQLDVTFDDQQLRWGDRRLVKFSPAEELEVVGFRNRYRQPGIGAPLAAATKPLAPIDPAQPFVVGPHVRVPVTLLLRVPDPRQQIRGTQLTALLELHPATVAMSTEIDERTVALAQEPTAALALALNESQPWSAELASFLGQVLQTPVLTGKLGGLEPHRQGRIPIVLVHGTASNFSVWANMVNDLSTDPVLREHFEFWLFGYDSGQPILYSAMQLRRALKDTVAAFQAADPDPCLDRMVVIGHSQGGLLTKLTAVNSGDLFWRNVSDVPIDQAELSPEARAMVEQAMFVEPLPFVRRVVFIATPQRGSYLAGPDLVRRLARRLITLPAALVTSSADLLRSSAARQARIKNPPTSIDNMSPGHPFILTIATIPVSPEVAANSIVGVTGGEPLESGGDGVVKYSSAHVDGVESELIVNSEHSMQSKPEVISEVQRILHRHLELNQCVAGAVSAASGVTGDAAEPR